MEPNPCEAPKAKRLPVQFGLFALLVVTTTVAIACAVVRLPIPLVAKLGPLWALLICLIG